MNIIKEYRIKNDLTQKELADKAEVSVKTIQGIEQNIRKPGTKLMMRLFKILKIPLKNIEFFLDFHTTK